MKESGRNRGKKVAGGMPGAIHEKLSKAVQERIVEVFQRGIHSFNLRRNLGRNHSWISEENSKRMSEIQEKSLKELWEKSLNESMKECRKLLRHPYLNEHS